ncbi:MAG: ChbG/HpnK family deacetylase [Spirochaetaceae bacterium]|nr:MAG: ChbG/HpnK family deacetylase [Spirochaetaceae bacterium]
MSGIRLVTRADDAGMHAVANRAIRESVTEGIVRNVSLMAPAPAIRNAYQVLGDLGDGVAFGLHVTLTAEWENLRWAPLIGDAASSFVRADGSMHFDVESLESTAPDLDAVMQEVAAQLDLLRNLGFPITYIDEHMGIGRVPGLAERLLAFADEHGLIANRRLFDAGALARLPGFQMPTEHPGTEMADQLATVPAGTYLLVGHPATKDEEFARFKLPGRPVGEEAINRNRQRRMFMDIEIVDYCENVGIELCRYCDV